MGGLDPKYLLSGVILLQSREVYAAHMDTGYNKGQKSRLL